MADPFDRLFESLEILKQAVETHNGLPDDFPAGTVVEICDALLLGRNATRGRLLDHLIYAREKLSIIQSEHFLTEKEAEESSEPALTRRDRLHQAFATALTDLHTAIMTFAESEIESAEESEYSAVPTNSDATIEKIAAGAGTVGDGLKDAQVQLESQEATIDASAVEKFRAAVRSFVDARIAAMMLHIEAASDFVRKSWLDRLGRSFRRIPDGIVYGLRALAGATPGARILHRKIHQLEGRISESIIDTVEETANELADWLESRPRRSGALPRIFRDIHEPWCPEMVEIPPGEFLMGSPDDDDQALGDEKPPHRVKIGYRFAVGRYPVTFEEYDQFCADTGREKPEDEGWGRERRPAVNVSWDDAQAYVKWLRGETGRRYRLPTEAEWEYACRARSTTCYCFGDDESQLGEYAWYSGNSDGQTHPVGEKQANGFGLHDMHGNVWEWVEDVWHEDYSGNPPDDGSAWVQDGYDDCRVLRGGSRFDLSRILRSANRDGYVTVSRLNDVGFRVARTLS